MKKLFVLLCLLIATVIKSQTPPEAINYQGVARDAGGSIITSAIGIKFEIHQGSATGSVVYDETNTITPSSAGIFTTAIGRGISGIGTFSSSINWGADKFFLEVSIDPAGGTSYSSVGVSELLSVPYALYAKTSGSSQAFTAGNGISINSGTISNTSPDQTVTINGATGTYPNFTVTPSPSVSVKAGDLNIGVLGAYPNYTITCSPTLSVAGSLLSISNGNTVILPTGTTYTNGSGIALVSGTVITNTAPNQTVNITGPGVLGSYPNYTLASGAPSTSVTSGGANIIVNGTAPSYTISATTPSFQVNAPHTTTTLSLNNYSLNIAPTNITGAGVASVSGTYPNYNISVPSPTITSSGNTITIAQGTAVATTTFASGPWASTGGVLYPASNPTNDKVAIGQNLASSNLDVFNSAASSNTLSPVVYVNNTNAGFTANGVLHVKHSAGGGAAVFVEQNTNIGDGIAVNTNGSTNGANALQVQHFGLGSAGYFSVNNASNNSRVIDASGNGGGNIISAVNTNSSSTASTIYGSTNGSNALYINNSNPNGSGGSFNTIGCAVYASNTGVYHTIQALNSHTSSAYYAGYFTGGLLTLGKTTTSSGFAFKALNSLSTDLFNVRDDGNVGISVPNPGYRLSVFEPSNNTAAIYGSHGSAASSSGAHGVYGLSGNTHTLASGVRGENGGSGPAVSGGKTSLTGPAGRFEITNAGNNADGLFATTNGLGAAIHAVNGPTVAGSSNAAVWLEAGHLKSTQPIAPTASTIGVSGGGISAVSITLGASSTDVKGVMNVVFTTTLMINSGNNATVRVNFNKSYATPPVVVVTSLTDLGLLTYFVSNVTTSSFNLTIRNSTTINMSTAASLPVSFNYMVIE